MSKNILYIPIIFCACFLNGCTGKSTLPDMRETYSSRDTKPFGGYAALGILQNSFPENFVQQTQVSFSNHAMSSDTASLYFCLSKNFYTSQKDVEAILDFVYAGNSFFLSAAHIDSLLLEKIYCKIQRRNEWAAYMLDSCQETRLFLPDENKDQTDTFSYFYTKFDSHFTETNKANSRIIGYNSNNEANCIVFFWGKGKLFLHTDPRAFSNYFLLSKNNYHYMQRLLEYTGNTSEHVYWDNFYNRQNNPQGSRRSFSTFSELLKYPALARAFWLSLFLLLLYILFAGKRRQRTVKEIKPNQNSSVAFTETIARLYLQKQDNKNIADKMISYFNEYTRNNYFLYSNTGSDDFILALSRKSGVSLERTSALYAAIEKINAGHTVTDMELLALNERIQQFYKSRK